MTPLTKDDHQKHHKHHHQHHHHHHKHHNNNEFELKHLAQPDDDDDPNTASLLAATETNLIDTTAHTNQNPMLKANYGHKRSILRKLMIAQRQQFLLRKEQADFKKLKKNLADTSISNFSQASGHVSGGPDNGERKLQMNNDSQDDNMKYGPRKISQKFILSK
jgi:hypothetical protein